MSSFFIDQCVKLSWFIWRENSLKPLVTQLKANNSEAKALKSVHITDDDLKLVRQIMSTFRNWQNELLQQVTDNITTYFDFEVCLFSCCVGIDVDVSGVLVLCMGVGIDVLTTFWQQNKAEVNNLVAKFPKENQLFMAKFLATQQFTVYGDTIIADLKEKQESQVKLLQRVNDLILLEEQEYQKQQHELTRALRVGSPSANQQQQLVKDCENKLFALKESRKKLEMELMNKQMQASQLPQESTIKGLLKSWFKWQKQFIYYYVCMSIPMFTNVLLCIITSAAKATGPHLQHLQLY